MLQGGQGLHNIGIEKQAFFQEICIVIEMQIYFLLRDDLVEVHRFLQVGKDGGGFIALLGGAGEGEKQEQDGNNSLHTLITNNVDEIKQEN